MSAPFPFGFTVTVRRSGRNEFGDKTTPVTHEVAGCMWAPRSSVEDNVGRTSVIDGLQLYGPPRPDIRFDDEIILPAVLELAGQPEKRRTYRVLGDVGNWYSPLTGWEPGFEVSLERVS